MSFSFPAGLKGVASLIVVPEVTAARVASGALPVFATPSLVALSEKAAFEAVQAHLTAPWTTVGTLVNFTHVAATPLGQRVTATATLVSQDKRTLNFEVEIRDEAEVVGRGTHTRAIVDETKFMERVSKKASASKA